MAKLSKLAKVNDSFTVNRYDNGFMIEITGLNEDDDWKTIKVICNTDEDLKSVIDEYNQMEINN